LSIARPAKVRSNVMTMAAAKLPQTTPNQKQDMVPPSPALLYGERPYDPLTQIEWPASGLGPTGCP